MAFTQRIFHPHTSAEQIGSVAAIFVSFASGNVLGHFTKTLQRYTYSGTLIEPRGHGPYLPCLQTIQHLLDRSAEQDML
jgi:hypothetical protein